MIYDISQPLPDCAVYPGDSVPKRVCVSQMEKGALYNLSELSLCVHNGTHVDAPLHFLREGKGIDRVPLETFIGPAFVHSHCGVVTADDAAAILERAAATHPEAAKRLLLRGDVTVTPESAEVFADAGIHLLGNESQSVGPVDAPMAVHLILLKREVVLLEGIRLAAVPDGVYLLRCAPLNLTGSEGSPCRAVLIDL